MRYRFGRFLLVPETRELLADGEVRPVEPQVFDLLHVLIQARDRVVSLDELVAAVWQGRIVSDSAISARISAARTALDDDGKRQLWIRTLPRKGFRFVGQVEALDGGTPAASLPANQQKIAFCHSKDGTRLAYATSGAGYPMVKAGHWLTHLDLDWHSPIWRPHLDELNRHFSLLRYDQRGNGLSEWRVSDFTFERFVDDLEAVVDAAGLDRFALYGTSQGAPIALGFAHRHPERVSHLILHGGYEQGRLVRDGEEERAQGEAILTLMRHGWGRAASPFIEAFSTMFVPDGGREHIEALAEMQRRTTSAGNAVAIRTAVDGFNVAALLPEIAVPTLVIHSRDDGVQPLDQAYRLASRIPGARFLMLESRNHVILPGEKAWSHLYETLVSFVSENVSH